MTPNDYVKKLRARAEAIRVTWRSSTVDPGTRNNRIAGIDEVMDAAEDLMASIPAMPVSKPVTMEMTAPVLFTTRDGREVKIEVDLTGNLAQWMVENLDSDRLVRLLCTDPKTKKALQGYLGYDTVYERIDRTVDQLAKVDEAWAEKRGEPPEDIGDTREWYRVQLMAHFGIRVL